MSTTDPKTDHSALDLRPGWLASAIYTALCDGQHMSPGQQAHDATQAILDALALPTPQPPPRGPDDPPEQIWVGTIRGQWPIRVFVSEDQAITWVTTNDKEANSIYRRLWSARLVDLRRLQVIVTPPRLEPQDG